MAKIKTGDEVIVTTGKDRGKRGKVLKVLVKKNRLIVDGVNAAKKSQKPDPRAGVKGGMVIRLLSIHRSNVRLYDHLAGKGSRVGIRILEDGKRVRYFKSSGEPVEV